MDDASIKFATHILRRLGEELNPSVDQGIIELVKNSYDADALTCTVELDRVGGASGSVTVADDGDGMSLEQILEGWLVLGSSTKTTSKRTRLNRIPAGNKGLGRLAALRLGRKATLVTRPARSQVEYVVEIDWTKYDKVRLVEDVQLPIIARARTESHSGTSVRISALRRPIGRMDVKRLARSMILLADPFGADPSGFSPVLKTSEFRDLEKLVQDRYFRDADYHLVAVLTDGGIEAEVRDFQGRVLFGAGHEEIAVGRDGAPYRSPDSYFDLWAFTLSRQAFSTRSTSIQEVRSWIEAFGGVHLYLNGLRVAPYGNAGSDWLDMNLRRVQSPEERPSTNNSIGRVAVDDPTGKLTQKTDRGGFIEGTAFEELRFFAQDSLEWMARRRLAAAEARRGRERTAAPTQTYHARTSLREQIEKAPPEIRPNLELALERYDRVRQHEADALRREIQLYRTLSTAGITAATFAHESSGNPLKVIAQSLNAIKFRGQKALEGRYAETLANPVESIREATESLGVLSTATLRLVEADKRRVGRVDLHSTVLKVLEVFDPFLAGRDVTLEQKLSSAKPFLQGTEAAVESIVTNFLNNSLTAFEDSSNPQRLLSISSEILEDVWLFRVSDNGPGVEGIGLREIWLPGNTRRPGGTGLGLTIVRDAVADLGGTVSAEAHGELGGATFTVELAILGVE